MRQLISEHVLIDKEELIKLINAAFEKEGKRVVKTIFSPDGVKLTVMVQLAALKAPEFLYVEGNRSIKKALTNGTPASTRKKHKKGRTNVGISEWMIGQFKDQPAGASIGIKHIHSNALKAFPNLTREQLKLAISGLNSFSKTSPKGFKRMQLKIKYAATQFAPDMLKDRVFVMINENFTGTPVRKEQLEVLKKEEV